MADVAEKVKEARERGATKLPVNHPQAGYTSPDLSFRDSVGLLPDREQEWHDERDEAQAEGELRVIESDEKLAKEEQEAIAEYDEKVAKAREAQIEKQVAAGIIPAPVLPPGSEESKTSTSAPKGKASS